MKLMGIKDLYNVYFSYSRDDIVKFVMELDADADEVFEDYIKEGAEI